PTRNVTRDTLPHPRQPLTIDTVPGSYQSLSIHEVISFMASPWPRTATSSSRAPSLETGSRSSKWSGRYLPRRPIEPVVAHACLCSVGTYEHHGVAAAVARTNNPLR